MSRRCRPFVLMLAAGMLGGLACSGGTQRDMYYGTDAGSDFEVPFREVHPDTTGAGGAAGSGTTTGAGGDGAGGSTAGAAGTTGAAGAGGAAGAAGASDAAAGDAVSDGADG